MKFEIKLMNGDLVSLEHPTFCKKHIIQTIRNVTEDYTNSIKLFRDENNGLCAVVYPVHLHGKAFIKFLSQAEMTNLERNNYFDQIDKFVQNDLLRGDSIVNEDGNTAIEVLVNFIIKKEEFILFNMKFLCCFASMTKTTHSELLQEIAQKLFFTFLEDEGDDEYNLTLDDYLDGTPLTVISMMLGIIGELNNLDNVFDGLYHLFDDVELVDDNTWEALLEENCDIKNDKYTMKKVLKYSINQHLTCLTDPYY